MAVVELENRGALLDRLGECARGDDLIEAALPRVDTRGRVEHGGVPSRVKPSPSAARISNAAERHTLFFGAFTRNLLVRG